MYRITKEIRFCYGHRLLNHAGKCRHLHGHNARAVITIERENLDDQGMVYDFGEIGDRVKTWIDSKIDHTMLMHRDDPFLPALIDAGERVEVVDWNPTAENIARMIYEFVADAGYPVTDVTLWETETACASFGPSKN